MHDIIKNKEFVAYINDEVSNGWHGTCLGLKYLNSTEIIPKLAQDLLINIFHIQNISNENTHHLLLHKSTP